MSDWTRAAYLWACERLYDELAPAYEGISRMQSLATAQAQWLLFGLPLGWIEATANLGIELYDVITVDQVKARVVGITETFARGRLRQRLELAEVSSFGVSVG